VLVEVDVLVEAAELEAAERLGDLAGRFGAAGLPARGEVVLAVAIGVGLLFSALREDGYVALDGGSMLSLAPNTCL